jgi:hypothetical protein
MNKAKAEAIRQLNNTEASLRRAKANERKIRKLLDGLSKLVGSVQQGPKMLRTPLPMDAFVDRCLADLEKKSPPPWVVEGVTAYANAAAGGWPKGKAPRTGYVVDAHAFEKYMAEWMRWLGWDDAKAMPVGPDEGIDVQATGALGQAKHWDHQVGIEEVQRHNGVCDGIQKYGRVFLSKSGYTPQAIKWANDRDLPLFEMENKAGSKTAGVVASTKAGEKLLKVGAKAMKGNKRN